MVTLSLIEATDIPVWAILLPLILVLLYVYGSYPYGYWQHLGYADGPKPIPFFGCMQSLFDPKKGTVACISDWLDKYGRVVPVFWFRDPMLIIADPAALREIFTKNFNNWTDRYMLGRGDLQQDIIKKGLFFAEGSDWRRIRKIMSPTFSSNKLKLLAHHMNMTSARLAEKMHQSALVGKTVFAKNVFGAFALDTICSTAFGWDTNFQNDPEQIFLKHTQSMMSFDTDVQVRMTFAGLFPAIGKIFKLLGMGFFRHKDVKYFRKTLSDVVQERKVNSADQKHADFLQLLLNAEAREDEEISGARKLTTEEITAQGIIFIIAGYETTSSILQFLMFELSRHPEVQEKLVEEMEFVLGTIEEPGHDSCRELKYMEAVINESLRMYPPVHLLTRQAEHDTTINGRRVPAGTAVLLPLVNIGRDPEFYPDPYSFKPERFLGESKDTIDPVTFLPFGLGPRQCIGLRLGIMEMKTALVHILRKVKVTGATPSVLELNDFTGVLVPKSPIQLHLEPVEAS